MEEKEIYIKKLEEQNEKLQEMIRGYVKKYEENCSVSCSHLKNYSDKDYIMLHVCFQLLVDFVEKELNGKFKMHSEKGIIKALKKLGFSQDDLEAEILNIRSQNAVTKEIKELYTWWKKHVSKYADQNGYDSFKTYDIEQEYLMRLIKIRGYLWT